MFNFHVKPKVPVIPAKGVETMGAGCDNFGHSVELEFLDVLVRQLLVEIFIPKFSFRFATAFFLLTQDANFYPGSITYLDKISSYSLFPFVEGSVTTKEV